MRGAKVAGEAIFVGKDVADQLGYTNSSQALTDHCRGVSKRYPIFDKLGRVQETRFITRADLLRLIVNSTLPAAEKFERWVFEEVLPSIMDTGSYTNPQSAAALVRPMLKILEQNGVTDTTGRRTLSRVCSGLLRTWCIANSMGGSVRICKYTGRLMYHIDAVEVWLTAHGRKIIRVHQDRIKIDAVEVWLTAHGRKIIRVHQDRIKGQGVLRLVVPAKRKPPQGSAA